LKVEISSCKVPTGHPYPQKILPASSDVSNKTNKMVNAGRRYPRSSPDPREINDCWRGITALGIPPRKIPPHMSINK